MSSSLSRCVGQVTALVGVLLAMAGAARAADAGTPRTVDPAAVIAALTGPNPDKEQVAVGKKLGAALADDASGLRADTTSLPGDIDRQLQLGEAAVDAVNELPATVDKVGIAKTLGPASDVLLHEGGKLTGAAGEIIGAPFDILGTLGNRLSRLAADQDIGKIAVAKLKELLGTEVPSVPPVNLPSVPSVPPVNLPSVPSVPPVKVPSVPSVPPVKVPSVPSVPSVPPVNLPSVPPVRPPGVPPLPDPPAAGTPSPVPLILVRTTCANGAQRWSVPGPVDIDCDALSTPDGVVALNSGVNTVGLTFTKTAIAVVHGTVEVVLLFDIPLEPPSPTAPAAARRIAAAWFGLDSTVGGTTTRRQAGLESFQLTYNYAMRNGGAVTFTNLGAAGGAATGYTVTGGYSEPQVGPGINTLFGVANDPYHVVDATVKNQVTQMTNNEVSARIGFGTGRKTVDLKFRSQAASGAPVNSVELTQTGGDTGPLVVDALDRSPAGGTAGVRTTNLAVRDLPNTVKINSRVFPGSGTNFDYTASSAITSLTVAVNDPREIALGMKTGLATASSVPTYMQGGNGLTGGGLYFDASPAGVGSISVGASGLASMPSAASEIASCLNGFGTLGFAKVTLPGGGTTWIPVITQNNGAIALINSSAQQGKRYACGIMHAPKKVSFASYTRAGSGARPNAAASNVELEVGGNRGLYIDGEFGNTTYGDIAARITGSALPSRVSFTSTAGSYFDYDASSSIASLNLALAAPQLTGGDYTMRNIIARVTSIPNKISLDGINFDASPQALGQVAVGASDHGSPSVAGQRIASCLDKFGTFSGGNGSLMALPYRGGSVALPPAAEKNGVVAEIRKGAATRTACASVNTVKKVAFSTREKAGSQKSGFDADLQIGGGLPLLIDVTTGGNGYNDYAIVARTSPLPQAAKLTSNGNLLTYAASAGIATLDVAVHAPTLTTAVKWGRLALAGIPSSFTVDGLQTSAPGATTSVSLPYGLKSATLQAAGAPTAFPTTIPDGAGGVYVRTGTPHFAVRVIGFKHVSLKSDPTSSNPTSDRYPWQYKIGFDNPQRFIVDIDAPGSARLRGDIRDVPAWMEFSKNYPDQDYATGDGNGDETSQQIGYYGSQPISSVDFDFSDNQIKGVPIGLKITNVPTLVQYCTMRDGLDRIRLVCLHGDGWQGADHAFSISYEPVAGKRLGITARYKEFTGSIGMDMVANWNRMGFALDTSDDVERGDIHVVMPVPIDVGVTYNRGDMEFGLGLNRLRTTADYSAWFFGSVHRVGLWRYWKNWGVGANAITNPNSSGITWDGGSCRLKTGSKFLDFVLPC